MAVTITTNILGQYQAESDTAMLRDAFVETPEYRTLAAAAHSHVVVGRRGVGKSALFIKLREYHRLNTHLIPVDITPDELDVIGLRELCKAFGAEFHIIRSTARLAWHAAVLCEILAGLRRHYRYKNGLCRLVFPLLLSIGSVFPVTEPLDATIRFSGLKCHNSDVKGIAT